MSQTNRWFGAGLLLALLCGTYPAHAQKATERYIPLGRSPGLSTRYTTVARIDSVDPTSHTLTASGTLGTLTVKITDRTKIWLDRTPVGLTSVPGEFADCQPGRTIEVKYEDHARKRLAEWVKIQISEPEPRREGE